MSEYLVLEVRPYDFTSDGQHLEGVKVTYLDLGSPAEGNARGFSPLSVTAAPGLDAQFGKVPGFYELDFRQRAGARGRPQLVLTGAHLVRAAGPSVVGSL